jgi:hypothetical protein
LHGFAGENLSTKWLQSAHWTDAAVDAGKLKKARKGKKGGV